MIQCSCPIYLFLHVCMIGNYMDILRYYSQEFRELNLFPNFQKIYIGILGRNDDTLKEEVLNLFRTDGNHVELLDHSEDTKLYERITLHNLYSKSLEDNFHALYLHTKGVTHPPHAHGINLWRHKMTFFLTHYMTIALHHLDHGLVDAVGIDFIKDPRFPHHYSGNFWWTTSSHVRQLNVPIGGDYLSPEMWISSRVGGRYMSLYQTPRYNFYQGVNVRNRAIMTNQFTNNTLDTRLLNPSMAELFIQDIYANPESHWYGHPPHWLPIDHDSLRTRLKTGIHKINHELFGLDRDPFVGKIKFWIFRNEQSIFSCYIENQHIVMRSKVPIHLDFNQISDHSWYGTTTNESQIDKNTLKFVDGEEIIVNTDLFGGCDPHYGQLKRWKFFYNDNDVMELPEHQPIVIFR